MKRRYEFVSYILFKMYLNIWFGRLIIYAIYSLKDTSCQTADSSVRNSSGIQFSSAAEQSGNSGTETPVCSQAVQVPEIGSYPPGVLEIGSQVRGVPEIGGQATQVPGNTR
jgi:hypothetical protein